MTSPHTYTLTGNLLAERTLEVADWKAGGTFRATSESFQVGGKGINVSKMLNRFGAPNTALCFIGGAAGDECESWLQQRGFYVRGFRTSDATRQGTVVRSPSQPETTFLGPDVAPDASAVESCAAFLHAQPDGQILAVCGSIPGWTDKRFNPLREALTRWISRGTLVVDTYGPPLAWFARQPIELLKVNATEIQTIAPPAGGPPPIAALRYVITDGPNPVRLRERAEAEMKIQPPRVREVSPTGSGDVLLACLIEGLFRRRKPLREAVEFALPYAAANAAHPGVADFPEPS